jgi:hypothetical protein
MRSIAREVNDVVPSEVNDIANWNEGNDRAALVELKNPISHDPMATATPREHPPEACLGKSRSCQGVESQKVV